jgi:hypothetical protein
MASPRAEACCRITAACCGIAAEAAGGFFLVLLAGAICSKLLVTYIFGLIIKPQSTMFAKTNAMIQDEIATGMRFCITCNKHLSLDHFAPGRRKFKCITHYRESRRMTVLGTSERRAFNSLRSRARQDMILFGQTSMDMGVKLIGALLTPMQMENYSSHCIVPRDPSLPLSQDNSIAVTTAQRRYVVSIWKPTRDAAVYRSALQHILNAPQDGA